MTEKLVKNALKKYLHEIGAYYYMPVSMGYGSTSIDFFVCYKGMFYGIETKSDTYAHAKPTPRQLCVLKDIALAGGECWVENSVELTETRKVLFKSEMWDDPVIYKTVR